MLDIFTVSLFGHRVVDNLLRIEEQLEKLIKELLSTKEYVVFLVGRNGEFDRLASSAIKKVKKTFRDDNCSLCLVLPYDTAEYRDNYDSFNEYYDNVEICKKSYFKSAFQKRNRDKLHRSDLVVFYLEHDCGGAYQTFQYAVKQGKNIIKLP